MSETKTCPTCGTALASDATRGVCPACLLEAGLATGPGGSATPSAADRLPTVEELAPRFPGLEIGPLVGRGGMGVVFRARHKALDREVALKVLSPAVAEDRAFADRFRREARALAKLQHPNIVAVHDFGATDGLYWLVMEYVDGVNVREAMRAGHVGPAQALAIVPQICDALQYAHEHRVVHRDIKPENILLDKAGRVKVADFGLAKLMDRPDAAAASLTGAGQVMGTLHYMAPEQWERPKDVDHRADIYSLGVVFYEMLTGELPVGRFAAPSTKSAVDARIDEIVLRTLEREREARYQSVSQVRTDVSAVAQDPGAGGGRAAVERPAPARDADPGERPTLRRLVTMGAVSLAVPVVVALTSTSGVVRLATSVVGFVTFMMFLFQLRRARRHGVEGDAAAVLQKFPASVSAGVAVILVLLGGLVTYAFIQLQNKDKELAARKPPDMTVAVSMSGPEAPPVPRPVYESSDSDAAFPPGFGMESSIGGHENPDIRALKAAWAKLVRAGRARDVEAAIALYAPEERESVRALAIGLGRPADFVEESRRGAYGMPLMAVQMDPDALAAMRFRSGLLHFVTLRAGGDATVEAYVDTTPDETGRHQRVPLLGVVHSDSDGKWVEWFFQRTWSGVQGE